MILNKLTYEKQSDWQCTILGTIIIRPTEKHIPSLFRRKLHELLLGVKWSKAKTKAKEVAVSQ
jgi:hypothetical protein